MKTIPLALCGQPLIESPQRPAPVDSPGVKRSMRGFLERMMASVCRTIDSWAPAGFEDENGFHYGNPDSASRNAEPEEHNEFRPKL